MSLKQTLKQLVKRPVQSAAARFGPQNRRSDRPRLWVLMYHRILPPEDPRYASEEPGMIVHPDTLRMHLRVLRDTFTLMPLGEWVARAEQGRPLPDKACAITFDDGWRDNYEYAFPILQQEQVPATLFAVSGLIGTREQFWPNRIVRLLQQPVETRQSIGWLNALAQEGNLEAEASAQVIYSLKQYPDDRIIGMIEEAESSLGLEPPEAPALMDWEELRELSDSSLVEIGSHTCRHVRLREDLDHETLKRELVDSKAELTERLGRPVDLFCYPNGDYCAAAVEGVRRHYRAAVTTRGGINAPDGDSLLMHRFGVHQHSSDRPERLLARLSGWPMT